MPLVKAQCTNCGASLEVDKDKEAAICPYCNTPYIVEKAIQQYITNNTYNIESAVFINNDEEKLIKAGIAQLELEEWDDAADTFKKAINDYPGNYKSWLGAWILSTMGMSFDEEKCRKNTIKLCPEGMKEYIENNSIQSQNQIENLSKRVKELEKQKDTWGDAYVSEIIKNLDVASSELDEIQQRAIEETKREKNLINIVKVIGVLIIIFGIMVAFSGIGTSIRNSNNSIMIITLVVGVVLVIVGILLLSSLSTKFIQNNDNHVLQELEASKAEYVKQKDSSQAVINAHKEDIDLQIREVEKQLVVEKEKKPLRYFINLLSQ